MCYFWKDGGREDVFSMLQQESSGDKRGGICESSPVLWPPVSRTPGVSKNVQNCKLTSHMSEGLGLGGGWVWAPSLVETGWQGLLCAYR